MSEVNGENVQGAESGETAEVNAPSLSSQMQENINKMTGLLLELHLEKPKVEGLQQEKLALEEKIINLEHLVSQMPLCNEERESILLVLHDYANYITIRELKKLLQQKLDLKKERGDLKGALLAEVLELGDKIDDMSRKLDDLEKRFNDY